MLFQEFKSKNLSLKNRIVMAPMTRARTPDGIPDQMNALYYAQRSGAGLIVTEGIAISSSSQGTLFVPGIYTNEQADGWKLVTASVHEKGTKIFAQLWHVGRISHVSIQPDGKAPVGPTDAQAVNSKVRGYDGQGHVAKVPCSKPRALETEEIQSIVEDYAIASTNAIKAGFDGVELHAANGYLFEQFLNAEINTRKDQYGGSIENRSRFLLESIDACIDRIGAEKVAVRVSPYGGLYEMPPYDEVEETYRYLATELTNRNIAYTHIMDQRTWGSNSLPDGFLERFRGWYKGTLILAG